MSLAIGPLWIISAFVFAMLYDGVVKPRDPTGRVRYVLALLWSLLTLTGIYWAILWIPQPGNPTIPQVDPTPEFVFFAVLLLVVLPEVSVLGLMIIDLILFRSGNRKAGYGLGNLELFWQAIDNARHLVNAGQLHEAKELFIEATLDYPREIAGWRGLGLTLVKLAAYEEALSALDRALELDPRIAECWYNKAHSHARLSKKVEAIEALKKAISLSEQARQLAKSDPAFESLREDSLFQQLIGESSKIHPDEFWMDEGEEYLDNEIDSEND